MKKILSLVLCLALMLGMSASTFAEGLLIASNPASESSDTQQDEAMKQVILTVKKTLDLNTEAYTEFNGDSYTNGKQVLWNLSWYNDNGSLSVTASETGKIYSYYYYDYNQSYASGKGLHFPQYCFEDAVKAGDAFLKKVLSDGETVVWEEYTDSLRNRSRYNISGVLYQNGLPTEIGVDMTMNTADGRVMSFSRYDKGVFIEGELPSEIPAFEETEALKKFAPAISSCLQWVITDYETMEARLMYVFERDYDVLLDAQTGKLINRNDSYEIDSASGKSEAAADSADERNSLTEVEIIGAEKYAGALDGATLLATAKAELAFGITDSYVIGNVRYTANQVTVDPLLAEDTEEPDEGVTATYTLRYELSGADLGLSQKEYEALIEEGYQPTVSKSITADAHTGEVKNLYTWYSGFGWMERKESVTPTISQTAEDFLNERYSAYMPLTELTDANQSSRGMAVNTFRYVRMHEGYALNVNSIQVSVNAATGFVDGFSCCWDENVCFGPSSPLVGEEAAMESYLNTYKAVLGYSLLPEDPDNWETAYYWMLTYKLESDSWCYQVDAVTGEADAEQYDYTAEKIAYTDLNKSYAAKEIEKLAKFGVGYYGVDEFQPAKQVTELDMILFLLSADGYCYDYNAVLEMEQEELNWLYRSAKNEGFISTVEQNPNRLVTRSELCRSFVPLADMTDAAQLKGIFACGFTDDDSIAAEDYGYVAIAKGLGIVSGDTAGTFRPNDGATRQELAIMLYRYLSR